MLWTNVVGEGYAGVAIRDEQVYLLDRIGQEQDVLRCFALATGKELWRLAFDAPGKTPHPGSRNVPTVDEKFIFAVGPLGHFYCVDRTTHQLVWSHHIVNDFKDPDVDREETPANRAQELARTRTPMWGVSLAPQIYRDLVFAAPLTQKIGLVAYEKATGKIRWQTDYLGRNWYNHASPHLIRLGGVDQVIVQGQPSDPEKWPPAIVSGVDAETGQILWKTKTPMPHKIPVAQPLLLGDDRLFFTGGYRMGCGLLQVTRNDTQWDMRWLLNNRVVAGHLHTPILYQDHIYVSSSREYGATNTGLVCLDKEIKSLWQSGPTLHFDNGPMLIADGMVLILNGKTGELCLYDANPKECKLLAKTQILEDKKPWAPMALSDGKLIIRDLYQMKCLDLKGVR